MKNLIMPGGALLIVFIVVMIVIGAEFVAADVIDGLTKVAENVTCQVKGTEVKDGDVALKLDCGGKEMRLTKAKVVVSYLQDPGPLTCSLYKNDSVRCEPRKKS